MSKVALKSNLFIMEVLSMMLSYNSVKCVICHNSGLESISKFLKLVINGVYIDGSVLVASLVGKTRLLLQEAKGCRRYMYFSCLSNISVHRHIISISVSACSFSM